MTDTDPRTGILADSGLAPGLASLLTGDEATMREQADELARTLATLTRDVGRRPRPDPTQGAKPTSASGQLTAQDAQHMTPAQIVKAKAEGRFDDLLGRRNH